jgi:hypothetical protein
VYVCCLPVDESESVSRHLGLMIPDKSEVHQPVAALAAAGAKVLSFEGVKMVTSVRATQGKITVRGRLPGGCP